ncbi:pyridoxal phosphate-dependent aminotransferase [Rubrivivax albus]|uniref:Aminotransferase n=1 Tax=Rubrivivax albus TaxID=2499835 RepID=A0A437K1X2_9BURK|nr:pyridoxal phosphate-dependent aminotransferase [Rubrivivax albus]RVT54284.1 pyridoxal phosphate-dependent aminotransferase [Rubrivivax albus]
MTRPAIDQLPASRIREVANAGLGRNDVLAFWFGESDEVTPQAVRDAAAASLQRGETFYSHNLGLAELREAIAGYTTALHSANGPVGPERIAVTSSGVSALMVAMQMLAGAGDEVVAVVPVWPNLTAQPAILGAEVVRVPLVPRDDGAWTLDLARVLSAVTDRTRVLLVNAPNNPTGWTLTRDEQQALLDHCRRTGTWIVADEVYERVWFGNGPAAPSFLDLAAPHDRLVVVHSFSKSFLMTGWRLGWMVLPPGQLDAAGKLLEFNTSCPPVFVQRGALAALAMADGFVPGLVQRLKAGRDRLHDGLARLPGVHAARPLGGMYAWFRVDGEDDSLALAKRLVRDHGLGLAPGVAFGPEGEGWLRWCFASQDLARLDAGVQRLADALRR